MPVATGTIESCERICSSLEKEVDSVFDAFLAASEGAEEFHGKMGRVEEQLAIAQRMQNADSDLDLNETAVIADKVESELAEAERLALGAALSDTEEEWAGEFEKARGSLAALSQHLKKIKSSSGEHDALGARSSLLTFRRHARSCHMRLMRLKSLLVSRRHHTHAKVDAAKRKVAGLRANVGHAFDRIAKLRLGKKISEAKAEVSSFMKRSGSGRVFLDHKHLTFSTCGRVERVPLTQALRFALQEIVPIEAIGKAELGSSHVVGSYEKTAGGLVLKLGERTLDGDSIVYREKTYRVQI
jgi:hypothetical protein